MLTRKQYALVKIETTSGTDAEPDLSNRIETVNEFNPTPYDGDTLTPSYLRPHMGGFPEVNAAPYTTLSITVPAAGSGEAGTAPSYGPLLRACGLSETINDGASGDASVIYQPISENFESATIYFVLDGQLHKITNAIGTATFNFNTGEFPTIQFDMMGAYHHPESAGDYTGKPSAQADEKPVNSSNTTISVHGFDACGQSFSLTQNNTTTHRNLIGCDTFKITDRDSNGNVQIDAPELATQDYFNAVESHQGAKTGVISLVHGKTAGNIITVNEPASQLSSISVEDQDGVVQYGINYKALPVDGDDEFTVEFT